VALIYVLTQAVFVVARDQGPGIAIAWAGSFYKAEFSQYFDTWFDGLALVDAALVGIALTVGTTVGLVLASDWLAWWHNLVNRAAD